MYIKRLAVSVSSSILMLMGQFVFANADTSVSCPTSEQIQQYSLLASFPFGFNNESKQIKSFAVAANVKDGAEITSGWALMIQPVEVSLQETVPQAIQGTIEKLIPVSNTPYHYTIIDGLEMPVCAYTVPGKPEINALAYFVDSNYDDMDDGDFDDDFAKLGAKLSPQRFRLLKIAKQLKQFIHQ